MEPDDRICQEAMIECTLRTASMSGSEWDYLRIRLSRPEWLDEARNASIIPSKKVYHAMFGRFRGKYPTLAEWQFRAALIEAKAMFEERSTKDRAEGKPGAQPTKSVKRRKPTRWSWPPRRRATPGSTDKLPVGREQGDPNADWLLAVLSAEQSPDAWWRSAPKGKDLTNFEY